MSIFLSPLGRWGAPKWESTASNYFTLARMWLGVPVVLGLTALSCHAAAFWAFVAFAATDAIDGNLARVAKTRSAWGAYHDPCADKFYGNPLLLYWSFAIGSTALLLVVLLVISYDILVMYARSNDKAMRTTWIAKGKQVMLFVGLGLLFANAAGISERHAHVFACSFKVLRLLWPLPDFAINAALYGLCQPEGWGVAALMIAGACTAASLWCYTRRSEWLHAKVVELFARNTKASARIT